MEEAALHTRLGRCLNIHPAPDDRLARLEHGAQLLLDPGRDLGQHLMDRAPEMSLNREPIQIR